MLEDVADGTLQPFLDLLSPANKAKVQGLPHGEAVQHGDLAKSGLGNIMGAVESEDAQKIRARGLEQCGADD